MSEAPRTSAPSGGILGFIEWLGNKLPDPVFLFLGATVLVMVLSTAISAAGIEVVPKRPHVVMEETTDASGTLVKTPKLTASGRPELTLVPSGEHIRARSLLSSEGAYWLVANVVRNFMNFPPLGVVLVSMFGIGVAEKVGLFGAAMKWIASLVPSKLLTPTVVFLGVMSNIASDAGYIVLPPLAAALYSMFKRPPLAGITAAFAGVAAGFSANLLVGSTDALVAGITETGARVIEPQWTVLATSNWWFMAASTFLLTFLGWGVTSWIVEPRLAARQAALGGETGPSDDGALSSVEARGLRWALVGVVAAIAVIASMLFVPRAPLYGNMPAPAPTFGQIPNVRPTPPATFQTGDTPFAAPGQEWVKPVPGTAVLNKGYVVEAQGEDERGRRVRGQFRVGQDAPLEGRLEPPAVPQPRWSTAIVPIILFVFLVPGLAFGIATGALKNTTDVSKAFISAMVSMAPIVAMAFFASQFLACFRYSRLDEMIANAGGAALVSAGLPPMVLLVALIMVVMLVNILMSSMSAKWTALAPIFVPMLMMAGISPELTQAAYRVGDSCTNVVTPLNTYMLIILVAAQKWDRKIGIGNIIAAMVPYSAVFAVVWTAFLLLWVWLGLPLGPGAPMWYTPQSH